MDLSIIIVPWNNKNEIRRNLQAIYANQGDFSYEVIAVDNNSEDGTADIIKNEFPKVNLIANSYNVGFARACNQGVRVAHGDILLLLNPDMEVKPDTLQKMIDWMRTNPNANVAGPHLVDKKGKTVKHVRRFPRFLDQLAIVLKVPHIWPGVLNKYLRVDFDYAEPSKVDSVRGSFFMVNTKAKNHIPLWLDERYFVWFEEVDYCRQVKKHGGEVWYTPVAECIDYVGKSFEQVNRLTTQKYMRESMLKYFKKWHPAWHYRVLWGAWWLGLGIAKILLALGYKRKAKT